MGYNKIRLKTENICQSVLGSNELEEQTLELKRETGDLLRPSFCYICLGLGHFTESYFSAAFQHRQKTWWSVFVLSNHRRYPLCVCQTVAMSADRLSSMPESMSLCLVGTAAAPEQELLCIFGTGDMGRSLGQRFLQTGYRVVYGSRRPHNCGPMPQGAQVQDKARHHQKTSTSA